MSLSKVFESSKTFQPEDIVRRPDQKDPVWQSIIQPTSPPEIETPPPEDKPPTDVAETVSDPPSSSPPASSPDTNAKDNAPRQQSAGEKGTITKEKQQPQTPPGIPQDEVDQMLAKAYEQGLKEGRQEGVKEGVKEGIQEGIKEGLQRAEADFGSATKALLNSCQQLDSVRETILKNSVGEIQELVLAIAEKIIRHSLQEQQDTILATVDEAIHKAVKSEEFYVFVNPQDYDTVSDKATDLVAGISGLSNMVVKKDPTIEPGGCRIESDNCTVDATIVSQFDIIRNQIKSQ